MHSIITIGREYGSGGREIGRLLAEKLGYAYYDKEILELAAQDSGMCQEVFERHDERAGLGSVFSGTAASIHGTTVNIGLQMPLSQRVFLAQFDTIRKIAADGNCVIVGRCADYVLKDVPGVTRVFLYAGTQARVERIMRVENVDEDKARELIRKTDKQRKNYYNFYADGNWGLRGNYDLMLRTDACTHESIVECIAAFVKMEDAMENA